MTTSPPTTSSAWPGSATAASFITSRLGPVENQGLPLTTGSVIQAPKGVCHGSVQPDGRTVGEDGTFLPGQTDRSRTNWRRLPLVHGGGVVDCPTGSPWRDLPSSFGKWNTVFKRFRDWVKADVFKRMFEAVSEEPDMEYAMVDATIVRVHRHGQGAKGGLKARLSASLAAV